MGAEYEIQTLISAEFHNTYIYVVFDIAEALVVHDGHIRLLKVVLWEDIRKRKLSFESSLTPIWARPKRKCFFLLDFFPFVSLQ